MAVPREGVARTARRGPWWLRFGFDVARGAALVLAVNVFVIQISVVRGHSMEPSLHDGDRLVVDRVSCSTVGIARYDVVILRYPADPSIDFVKRVVGLPGERIALEGGCLRINGEVVDEGFLHVPDRATTKEVVVPEGHYFVLGDNRPISCDSREFGLVPQENLKGKVRMRFWPPASVSVF